MVKKNILLFFIFSFMALPVLSATQVLDVEARVKRLESLLNSNILNEQQQQIEEIKSEISSLHEELESKKLSEQKKQANESISGYVNPAPPHIHARPGSIARYAAPLQRQAPWVKPEEKQTVQIEPPLMAKNEIKHEPVVIDYDGYESYQYAFNYLMSGNYKQAIDAFSIFMQTYPNSRYLGKSHFWSGEAKYLWRDYHAALDEYRYVLNNFPKSNKRQLASLKIGYSYYEIRDWQSSKSSLQQVVSVFPNTVAAKKAKEKLKLIKAEGH